MLERRRYDIVLMVGDVRFDWEIDFFHSMSCYVLTINYCVKLREGYIEVVDWMFPQFQTIKDTIVAFCINNILQGCVVLVDRFKISDVVGN